MPGLTDTGKTHLAIERMLGHTSGMIGFPLRLLARENDDKVVQKKGRGQVALVTGEKKILPPSAGCFLCTIQSILRLKAGQQRPGYRGAGGAPACEAGHPRTEQQSGDKRKRDCKPKVSDHGVNPNAVANPTGPGSPIMKTRHGSMQDYTAPIGMTYDQIILTADITNTANDVRQLGGMRAQAKDYAAVARDAMLALRCLECLLAINEFSSNCDCRCFLPVCIGASSGGPTALPPPVGPPFALTVEFDRRKLHNRR